MPGLVFQSHLNKELSSESFWTCRQLKRRYLCFFRGQFFPGLEMGRFFSSMNLNKKTVPSVPLKTIKGRIGLSDVKFLPKNIEWEGSFKVQKKTLLNRFKPSSSSVQIVGVITKVHDDFQRSKPLLRGSRLQFSCLCLLLGGAEGWLSSRLV